ncbi:MAG: hypothetical protein KDC54_22150, partial [Lewinella sp.]|nr:hypothetical protein [Lewinella sp.]
AIWIEEGQATQHGDLYMGEVSHFTPWNCDIQIPTAQLSGRLLNEDGTPFSNAEVYVGVVGFSWPSNLITDEEGYFSRTAPIGYPMELFRTYPGCFSSSSIQGTIIDLSPISEDTDLGDITYPNAPETDPDLYSALITGTAVSCEGAVLANTPVFFFKNNQPIGVTISNPDGSFNFTHDYCIGTMLQIQVVDPPENIIGERFSVPISRQTLRPVGYLPSCDSEQYTFFNLEGIHANYPDWEPIQYSRNNTLATTNAYFSGEVIMGDSVFFTLVQGQRFLLSHPDFTLGNHDDALIRVWDAHNQWGETTWLSCDNAPCGDIHLMITLNEGLGGFIEGTFDGQVNYENDYGDVGQMDITGSFRTFLSQ